MRDVTNELEPRVDGASWTRCRCGDCLHYLEPSAMGPRSGICDLALGNAVPSFMAGSATALDIIDDSEKRANATACEEFVEWGRGRRPAGYQKKWMEVTLMATEAQIKAQAKYDAENTRQVHLKLNLRTDKDVLARLDGVPSKQGYIKRLIREDLERAAE